MTITSRSKSKDPSVPAFRRTKAAFQPTSNPEALAWLKGRPASSSSDASSTVIHTISSKARALIIESEVSSQAIYEKHLQHTIWPGGKSGVTIGIGYDVGYQDIAHLVAEWTNVIPDAMIEVLKPACGVHGASANSLAKSMAGKVTVPWASAIQIFDHVDMVNWAARVERALPHTGLLSDHSFGALVSLAYNRGAAFDQPGPRFREMRAIKTHMVNSRFDAIPAEFRSMKRLWEDQPGLQLRREREALLFEEGLSMMFDAPSDKASLSAIGRIVDDLLQRQDKRVMPGGKPYLFPDGIGDIEVDLTFGGDQIAHIKVHIKGVGQSTAALTERGVDKNG